MKLGAQSNRLQFIEFQEQVPRRDAVSEWLSAFQGNHADRREVLFDSPDHDVGRHERQDS